MGKTKKKPPREKTADKAKSKTPGLLPHYYRIITEHVTEGPIIAAIIFFSFFIASYLFLPHGDFEKNKIAILKNKQNYSAHLNLAHQLIEANDFSKAEKELKFLEKNSPGLNKKQQEQFEELQFQYDQSTKEGLTKLIQNWQTFLKKNSHYKIGWLYLAYYQAKLGRKNEAQQSLKKAGEIDPGLPVEEWKKSLSL